MRCHHAEELRSETTGLSATTRRGVGSRLHGAGTKPASAVGTSAAGRRGSKVGVASPAWSSAARGAGRDAAFARRHREGPAGAWVWRVVAAWPHVAATISALDPLLFTASISTAPPPAPVGEARRQRACTHAWSRWRCERGSPPPTAVLSRPALSHTAWRGRRTSVQRTVCGRVQSYLPLEADSDSDASRASVRGAGSRRARRRSS